MEEYELTDMEEAMIDYINHLENVGCEETQGGLEVLSDLETYILTLEWHVV